MRLLGFNISREKAAPPAGAYSVPDSGRGWYSLIRESFTGAWQRNITVDRECVLSYHATWACITLIASDISKLMCRLRELKAGIWIDADSPAFSPVLKKPNRFQNRIQFWESWIISKLCHGNAYVLKERDNRGVVVALYVLNPIRVKPLVTDEGDVWYQLNCDNLAGLEQETTVPASEIIHDRFNCLFHPLVGLSPLYAAGVAAQQGVTIQNNSSAFFANRSQPGGMLVAPGRIDPEDAKRLKEAFESNFGGNNTGKIAVVGEGMTFQSMGMSAIDSQLIEQLQWTAEVVCSTFHVPPYKIGVGTMPPYTNVQALNVEYYSQCLQVLIEAAELCMDEGLGLDTPKDTPAGKAQKVYGVEFDVDGLLRMDSVTQITALKDGVGAGIMAPNEARAKIDLPKVSGGDTPYLQMQNYSLSALSKRDAKADPFAGAKPAAETVKPPANENDQAAQDEAAKAKAELATYRVIDATRRALANVRR